LIRELDECADIVEIIIVWKWSILIKALDTPGEDNGRRMRRLRRVFTDKKRWNTVSYRIGQSRLRPQRLAVCDKSFTRAWANKNVLRQLGHSKILNHNANVIDAAAYTTA
jgi:hypothetical protein